MILTAKILTMIILGFLAIQYFCLVIGGKRILREPSKLDPLWHFLGFNILLFILSMNSIIFWGAK